MLSIADLHIIASRGGGMIIDAGSYSAEDLMILASRAAGGGGLVILRNANRISADNAKIISSRSKGKVILDYTV
jgi:hypothetical protein